MKNNLPISLFFIFCITNNGCTNLEEKYNSNITANQVSSSTDFNALLSDLNTDVNNTFQNAFGDIIGLSEITTDEIIVPTRGANWGDNGIWSQLHGHRWDGNHTLVVGCFNDLCGVVFTSTNILQFNPTPEQAAVVRFYRALAMYWILDFFDQVPYREPGENTLLPAHVRSGLDAWDYIVNEINEIMPLLPADNPATSPTKNAAKVLLMKCYLNKGVYTNRQSPSFDVADMNKVIALADEVISSNQYTFSANYFDNFAPDNGNIGLENIFTLENTPGVNMGSNIIALTLFSLYYNSSPYGGVNGFSALSHLYKKFEDQDLRKGQSYPSNCYPNPGKRTNIGFLIGQQYNLNTDDSLYTSSGIPVAFDSAVTQLETGPNLDVVGIRPVKYAWDCAGPFGNDCVIFRLPDVLLMKAEAILRGGSGTAAGVYGSTALEIVNSIVLRRVEENLETVLDLADIRNFRFHDLRHTR